MKVAAAGDLHEKQLRKCCQYLRQIVTGLVHFAQTVNTKNIVTCTSRQPECRKWLQITVKY